MGRSLAGSMWAAAAALIALAMAGRAEASVCAVATTVDTEPSQPGSLRACIEAANGSASEFDIAFDPAVFSLASPGVIQLVDALPPLSSSAPIVIDGAAAAAVVIDGSQTVGVSGFALASGNHVLRNLTLRSFIASAGGGGYGDGTAVTLEDGSSGDTLENLVLDDNRGGAIFLLGNNVGTTIRGCEIHHNDVAGIRSAGDGTPPPCGPRIEITDNYFHDNDAVSEADDLMLPDIACVDVLRNRFEHNGYFGLRLASSDTHDIVITQNRFLDAPVGFFGGAHDNLFAFNTVLGVPGQAISAGDTFDDGGPATINNVFEGNVIQGATGTGLELYPGADGARVYDNTFYGNGAYGLEVGALSDIRIRNNLFVGNDIGTRTVSDAGNWIVDHNGYFANANGDCAEDCSNEPGAFFGDPGFASPPDDLSLASCASGAVDRGVDLGIDQPDLTGLSDAVTYNGAAPDLGALESACGARDGGSGGTSGVSGVSDAGLEPYEATIACGTAPGRTVSATWVALLAVALLARRRRIRRPRLPDQPH